MLQVLLISSAVNQYIVKEDEGKFFLRTGARDAFMACWKVAGAPVSPNAITLNS
jgi:hypothetical protein